MATKEIDKYADYRYKIVTPEELREAKWLIEQGLYKDMDDYIQRVTHVEIKIMKRQEAEKKKRAAARKKKRAERVRNKAA